MPLARLKLKVSFNKLGLIISDLEEEYDSKRDLIAFFTYCIE